MYAIMIKATTSANKPRKIAHPVAEARAEPASTKKMIAVVMSKSIAKMKATHTITLGR